MVGARLPCQRPLGFPRQYRLTQASQFERALRRADWRKRIGPLRLHAVTNTMPTARLGLVVAKRVLRRAADRNRARRIIRESFRINRARLPSFDVVVQVVEAGGSNEQFRQALDRLWRELEARG